MNAHQLSSSRSLPVPQLTRNVPSHDRLHRQHLRPANPDCPAVELVRVRLHLLGHLADLGGNNVVRDVLGLGSLGEKVEEEQGQCREEFALVWDAL